MSVEIAPAPAEYSEWLTDIKARVQAARSRAALAANSELVQLYWQIGRDILAWQAWGSKVIERPARDLREAFPRMVGLYRANLLCLRAFAEVWSDGAIVQQLAGQLSWLHNVVLITCLKGNTNWPAHCPSSK